jgi:hypothetical protein
MKKKPRINSGNINDKKLSSEVKIKPDESKAQENINAMKAEKEIKKSISRWDSDGGMDLCP